jgi:hypothetical protein
MQFSPVTSSSFCPNIFLGTLFSNTHSLYYSLNVRDQVPHPYRTTGKITVLYILIFKLFDSRREDRRLWMQRILHFPRIHFPGDKVAATRSWLLPSSYCSRNAWRLYLYSLICLYHLVSTHRDNIALPQLSLQFFSTTLFNTLSSLQQISPILLMCMLDLRRTDLSFLNFIIPIVLYYKIFKCICSSHYDCGVLRYDTM